MTTIENHIISSFPSFQSSNEFLEKMMEVGTMMEMKAGTVILNVEDYIRVIPFLINGLIKIYREDQNGNEILLYYINSGESCVISITTSLKDEKSSIKALVEEDSLILAVPKDDFKKLLNDFNILHSFTYNLFTSKYLELISSIDSLAFTDTKTRLFEYLKKEQKAKHASKIVGLTHKKIAQDLSTSREVVSRLLNVLKQEGLIAIDKKEIEILQL